MSEIIVSGKGISIQIVYKEDLIREINLSESNTESPVIEKADAETERKIAAVFVRYLQNGGQIEELPLDRSRLTSFQTKAFLELEKVRSGCTVSYTELAERVATPNHRRAVAQALKHNPFPIIIPCHRVLGKNSLGGFSSGLSLKRKLLKLERHD